MPETAGETKSFEPTSKQSLRKGVKDVEQFLDRKRTPLIVGGILFICGGSMVAIGLGLHEKIGGVAEKAKTAEEILRDQAIAQQLKLVGIDPTKWSDADQAKIARYTDGFQSDYLNAQRHLSPGGGTKESLEDFWAKQLAPDEKGGYSDERQIVSGMALITALQQQGLAGKACDRTALGQNIQKKLGYDPKDIGKFLDNEDKFCRFLQGQPGGKSILGAIPAIQARTHLAVTSQQELSKRSNADWKQNRKAFRSVRRS